MIVLEFIALANPVCRIFDADLHKVFVKFRLTWFMAKSKKLLKFNIRETLWIGSFRSSLIKPIF